MIPKLICWLFGHVRVVCNKSWKKQEDEWIEHREWIEARLCIRCGANL